MVLPDRELTGSGGHVRVPLVVVVVVTAVVSALATIRDQAAGTTVWLITPDHDREVLVRGHRVEVAQRGEVLTVARQGRGSPMRSGRFPPTVSFTS
jgi:hypothetical protein